MRIVEGGVGAFDGGILLEVVEVVVDDPFNADTSGMVNVDKGNPIIVLGKSGRGKGRSEGHALYTTEGFTTKNGWEFSIEEKGSHVRCSSVKGGTIRTVASEMQKLGKWNGILARSQ
eukprot:g41715.t1